jgi:hypothetical protein
MAGPSAKLVSLRPELATFEQLDMEMNRRGYVGLQILPAFNVSVAAGTFGVVTLKSLLANASYDTKRTSTGGYNRGNFTFEDRSYQTKENGWEEPIDERENNMYASVLDQEMMASLRAWEHVLNSLEVRTINASLGGTVTSGFTTAATAVWTNPVTARPIDDVFAALEAIWARTGVWADTLSMSRRAFRALRRTDQIRSEVKADGAGAQADQRKITPAMVAEILDVNQIIIADAIKNTANLGQAASIASVFPENQVLLSVTAKTNDFKEPCLGRTFHWGGDGSIIQGEGMVGVVEQYEEPQTRKRIIRVRHETSEFILYPQMGQAITGVR